MIPITRIDEYLAVISQDEDATGLPDQAVTRIDTYLSKIAGEAVAELPEPVTRIDRYLASIAGMDVVMDDPITRIDYYLATVAGVYSGELPEPVTRIDHYLYNWAEGGSLPWATFTGNPLQFNAPKAHTLRSTVVEFSPIQDLHGYSSPWPAGGGDNKFNPVNYASYLQTNGTYKATGTQVGSILNYIPSELVGVECVFSAKFDLTSSGPTWERVRANVNGSFINGNQIANGNSGYSYVKFTPTSTSDYVLFEYGSSGGNQFVFSEMQLEVGASRTSWTPYSNLCPISGWNSIDVYDEPDYDPTAQPMTTLSFGQTVYGGTAEVAEDGTGSGDGTYGYALLNDPDKWVISPSTNADFAYDTTFSDAKNTGDSYSGLKCSCVPVAYGAEPYGRWLGASNHMFGIKWADGTLADIKQAASEGKIAIRYELATPVPFAVTASDAPTAVKGINTIWSDANGDVTVEARAEAVNLSALQSMQMLLGGRYVNNHAADDLTDEEALDILLGGNER